MADGIYASLKKNVEKKSSLSARVTIKISNEEMEILNKKAEDLKMTKDDLAREYLLRTPIFDGSDFEDKKGKNKVVKTAESEVE